MRGIVAFDVDEVLGNFRDPILAALRRRVKADYPHHSEWGEWSHVEANGLKGEDFLKLIVEECVLEQMTLEPFAWSVVDEVRRMGFETAAVTARGYHPYGEKVTRDWLAHQELVMDWLRVVPFGITKVEALREIEQHGDVVLYVDDHHKHLESIALSGFNGDLVLMDRPWNRSCNDFPRVKDLSGLLPFIRRRAALAA